ncbi:MAG: ArsA family ATPase, partial [Acidimicrobiia bacterium]
QSWGEVQDYLTQVLSWAGADAIEAEELSVIPGLDEVFALAEIKSFASSGEWDVVVVDCAPTAETIRLLSLPDILSWYMQRIFPTQRKATRAVRPLLSRVMNLPIASEAVFGAMRRFYDRLDGIREILGDPTVTSARLVVNPERLVIAEARRTYSYLALFGYHVDAVIANRVLPEEVTDPWFDDLRLNQAARMVEIERDFAEVEVIRVPLRSHEPIGTERLEAIAEILYGDRESAVSVLSPAQSMKIRKSGQAVIVEIPVPLAEREDLDIGRSEAELFVTLGQYRRSIALPDSVARRTISHAELRNGKLRIRFEGE